MNFVKGLWWWERNKEKVRERSKTGRQKEIDKETKSDRNSDRETETQGDRQKETETDRQNERDRDRQTDKQILQKNIRQNTGRNVLETMLLLNVSAYINNQVYMILTRYIVSCNVVLFGR